MASHTVAGTSSYVDDKKVTKMTFSASTLSYKWVIMNANAVLRNLANQGERSTSFTVSFCEDNSSELSSWYLNIPRTEEIMLPIYLCQNESDNWTEDSRVLIMDCSISALHSITGEEIHTTKIPTRDCKLGQPNSLEEYGTQKFIQYKNHWQSSYTQSSDIDTQYLQNDTLTIQINANLLCLYALPIPADNIRQQLKTVFDEKTLSDISIECGGEVFQAHRIILASQSPVFKRMLETDMKEKQEKEITIYDLDKEVVSDMLTFLYTGSAPNLEVRAKELLNAANKYQLPRLMVMCKNKLEEQIKMENVIEILQLADLHGVRELMKECLEFIKTNFKEVQETTGWEDLKGNGDSRLIAPYVKILEYMCNID